VLVQRRVTRDGLGREDADEAAAHLAQGSHVPLAPRRGGSEHCDRRVAGPEGRGEGRHVPVAERDHLVATDPEQAGVGPLDQRAERREEVEVPVRLASMNSSGSSGSGAGRVT
jgi:hypothetical protein